MYERGMKMIPRQQTVHGVTLRDTLPSFKPFGKQFLALCFRDCKYFSFWIGWTVGYTYHSETMPLRVLRTGLYFQGHTGFDYWL